jgi:PPP family 3-phenylpropionic acid transporter
LRPLVPLAPAFAIYYAAYFIVGGLLQAYWPVWLTSRGLDSVQLGLLFLGGQWIRVGAILSYGHVADRFGVARPMIVALAIAGTLVIGAFALAHSFLALLLLTLAFALAGPPQTPLADGLAIHHAGARRFDYGRVRLWGSVGYIAAVLAGGVLLRELGVEAIYVGVLGGCALTALMATQLQAPAQIHHAEPAPPRAMLRLLASPAFWIFMIAAGASQVSHAVYYGFATLNWQQAGIDDRVIGLLWGEGVVAEVLLFAFAGRVLARIGVTGLLALAGIGGVLRWSGIALTAELPLLFPLQILHALTFGAAHLAAMHFMQRAVPERAMSSAQSLYYALPGGIGMGLAMSLSGVLFRDHGAHAYLAMALLSAVSLAGALLLSRQWSGGKII